MQSSDMREAVLAAQTSLQTAECGWELDEIIVQIADASQGADALLSVSVLCCKVNMKGH
jgi:hypothetical protein